VVITCSGHPWHLVPGSRCTPWSNIAAVLNRVGRLPSPRSPLHEG
jgi:hypothetical protein